MNTTAKIITGLLIGTVIGAVTGLLMAPASGKKTRKDITRKSKKIAKQVAGYVGAGEKIKQAAHKNGKAPVQAS
jgi:gas vesicle protein